MSPLDDSNNKHTTKQASKWHSVLPVECQASVYFQRQHQMSRNLHHENNHLQLRKGVNIWYYLKR